MTVFKKSDRMRSVHSDIRGPVFEEANRMAAQGIDVLRLNSGNPGSFGFGLPASLKAALTERMDAAVPYCDSQGYMPARKAICEYHKSKGVAGISPSDIFIGNGVSDITIMAALVLLNPGDEVLIPCPGYSGWTNSILIAGAKPVDYMCDESEQWYPDLDDIRKKITPRTKAIVLINPNNPTGAVYPKPILEKIVEIAREHGLAIFSDEIYDRIVMDGMEHISTASLCPDVLCITTNGLSKSHVVCGYRAGWMLVSGAKGRADDFVAGLRSYCTVRICSNALMQVLIPAALADNESTKAMILPGGRLYEQREACCRELAKVPGVSFVKNRAAFYLFPKLDDRFNISDDKRFAMDYLHAKHVLIIPGSGFGWPKSDHFRIVMLPRAQELADAMRGLGEFLSDYRQK